MSVKKILFISHAEKFINLWYNVLSDSHRRRVGMIEKRFEEF